MKRRAALRPRRRRARHRPPDLAGQLGRVPGHRDQGRDTDPARQVDRDSGRPAGAWIARPAAGRRRRPSRRPARRTWRSGHRRRPGLRHRLARRDIGWPAATSAGPPATSAWPRRLAAACTRSPAARMASYRPPPRRRGPRRGQRLGQRRVLRAVRSGSVRPLRHQAGSGLAGSRDLVEERRRAERRLPSPHQ